MGAGASCVTKQFIVEAGSAILREYFSKPTYGQMTAALEAPDTCARPPYEAEANEIKAFMNCQFLSGQKKAWNFIVWLIIFLSIMVVIVSGLALRLTWKLYRVVKAITVQFIAGNRLPTITPTRREPAYEREPEVIIGKDEVFGAWVWRLCFIKLFK